MEIRKYQSKYCNEIAELFYNTVHTVNLQDYSKSQLDVWATGSVDLVEWDKSFSKNFTVVAIESGIIIGFGDIDSTGYIDHLFVHKDYQRRGVATVITKALEAYAVEKNITILSTHASITAKPFFETRGYYVMAEQQVKRENQILTNYVMEKRLEKPILKFKKSKT